MSGVQVNRVSLSSLCLALGLMLLRSSEVQATEAYYLLMFGAQRTPNEPAYSHSFATFVRASWVGSSAPCLEAVTISWVPRALCIRIWALSPECGANLDLATTLRYASANGERISLWGPYQIDRALYLRAWAQARYPGSRLRRPPTETVKASSQDLDHGRQAWPPVGRSVS
jgi:hypothetical protein